MPAFATVHITSSSTDTLSQLTLRKWAAVANVTAVRFCLCLRCRYLCYVGEPSARIANTKRNQFWWRKYWKTHWCVYRGPETLKVSNSPCTMPTSASCLSLQKIYGEINACIWSTVKKNRKQVIKLKSGGNSISITSSNSSEFVAILHHHHHHVPEGFDVFRVPWSSRWSWSLHLFLGRPTFLRPFGLYSRACFGSLFVSILCTCCSHFFWFCFISFTMFVCSSTCTFW